MKGKTQINFRWFKTRYLLIIVVLIFNTPIFAKINLKKIERQKWVQITTPNFSVLSDQGEKAALNLVEKLEKFRLTYGIIGSVAIPDDNRSVKVVSTKSRDTYKFLVANNKDLKRTSGFFADRISGNYAVINNRRIDSKSTARQSATSILFHEYTHYLTANLSFVSSPYWYNEGIADYLSVVKFPDASTVKLGLPIEYHLYNLNQMIWKPIEEILKTTHIGHKERKDRYRMYSQSWLLIHYFKNNSERSAELTNYLKLVSGGVSIDEAFMKSFEMDFKELDTLLKVYKRSKRYSYWEMSLKNHWKIEDYKVQTLATDDVLYELGELLLNGRNAHDEARMLFERVVELNPQHASALAGLANIHMFKELDKAHTLITKAKEADVDNPWVSTISGHINAIYALKAKTKEGYQQYKNLAVKDYNHAINSSGLNLEAIVAAANMYSNEGRWVKAKELIEIAYGYAPSNYRLREKLIYVSLALGDIEGADQIIQLVKLNNHMSELAMENFNTWVEKTRLWFQKERIETQTIK